MKEITEVLEYRQQRIGALNCIVARLKGSPEKAKAVVILSHGYGASGEDLVGIAGEFLATSPIPKDQIEFIFPAAPIQLDPTFDSRAWWPLDMEEIQQLMAVGKFRELGTSSPEELPGCRDAIIEVIQDAKRRHSIEDKNVIVGGFSQGSMVSLDVGLNYSGQLGGLVLWSCALINEIVWTELAAQQQPMNVFQSHGTIDPILPFAGAEILRDLLVEHGHRVEFTRFAGPHTLPPNWSESLTKMLEGAL